MEKYLFTDGTNVVREVQSDEELQTLIRSSGDPAKIRIWVFNTSEWIPYSEFSKRSIARQPPAANIITRETKYKEAAVNGKPVKKKYGWPGRVAILAAAVATILLIYNFTRIKWHKAPTLEIMADRPANVPEMNIDSLIAVIEFSRGQKLDKVTATNLRIRNSWPDRIQVQLRSDRDTSSDGSKFYNISLSIDNSTGYYLDQAVVALTNWRNNDAVKIDTIAFENISYSARSKRQLTAEYRGDSLSLNFLSVRAKAFNFCYEAGKESNYGNLNDRWFCKD